MLLPSIPIPFEYFGAMLWLTMRFLITALLCATPVRFIEVNSSQGVRKARFC